MSKIIRLTESDLVRLVKRVLAEETEMTEACWKGYTQKGMKTMFGKRYPNCVKKESVGETDEASSPAQQAAIAINMKKKGIKPKVIAVTEEQFERLFEYNTEDPILMYEDEYGSVEETNFVVGDLLTEAEYQGRKVQLGKIMQGDIKKSQVYVKNDKGSELIGITLALIVFNPFLAAF